MMKENLLRNLLHQFKIHYRRLQQPILAIKQVPQDLFKTVSYKLDYRRTRTNTHREMVQDLLTTTLQEAAETHHLEADNLIKEALQAALQEAFPPVPQDM